MGLQTDIGYEQVGSNLMQRSLQRMGATRPGTAIFSKVMAPLDRGVYKLSKGRATAGRVFGNLPVVVLTTTGARSGQQRSTPLNAIPLAEDLALIGSNYGSGRAPAWAHNLVANPHATIAYNGAVDDVVASRIEGAEYEDAFAAAIRIYAGYAMYRTKATNEIPVFLLTAKGQQ